MITWPYILRAGHSDTPDGGACAMDAVNWLVHGKHGDEPKCACPIITAFVISGNDAMPDDVRQRLLPYLHRIAGSISSDHEAARVRVLWLAAVRVFAPMGLDVARMHGAATLLRALPDDVSATVAASVVMLAEAKERGAADALMRAKALTTGVDQRYTAKLVDMALIGAGRAKEAAHCAYEASVTAVAIRRSWAEATAPSVVRHQRQAARFSATSARAVAEVAFTFCAFETLSAIWDAYFATLDAALSAGPQGEPWSADVLHAADNLYRQAGGLVMANTEGPSA